MPRGGQNRLSVEQKRLKGTFRPSREKLRVAGIPLPKSKPKRAPERLGTRIPVPRAPSGMTALQRQVWDELAAELGSIEPSKVSQLRLAVAATVQLRSAALPAASYAPLLGQLERLMAGLRLPRGVDAAVDVHPQAGEVDVQDEGPFDEDGFPSLWPLPHFGTANYHQPKGEGDWVLRPEAIQRARDEWKAHLAEQRQGQDRSL